MVDMVGKMFFELSSSDSFALTMSDAISSKS